MQVTNHLVAKHFENSASQPESTGTVFDKGLAVSESGGDADPLLRQRLPALFYSCGLLARKLAKARLITKATACKTNSIFQNLHGPINLSVCMNLLSLINLIARFLYSTCEVTTP